MRGRPSFSGKMKRLLSPKAPPSRHDVLHASTTDFPSAALSGESPDSSDHRYAAASDVARSWPAPGTSPGSKTLWQKLVDKGGKPKQDGGDSPQASGSGAAEMFDSPTGSQHSGSYGFDAAPELALPPGQLVRGASNSSSVMHDAGEIGGDGDSFYSYDSPSKAVQQQHQQQVAHGGNAAEQTLHLRSQVRMSARSNAH